MKKILMLVLACVLALSLIPALAACNGDDTPAGDNTNNNNGTDNTDEPCTKHFDLDRNGECDSCGAIVDVPPTTEKITVILKGEGDAIFAGATVVALADGGDEFSAVTDAAGKAVLELAFGSYTFLVTEGLPENHYSDMAMHAVNGELGTVTLNVIDNTPDGSEDKPFTVPEEATEYAINAGSALHFSMRNADVTLTVLGNGLTLTLSSGTSFTSDNGKIEINVAEHGDVTDMFAVFAFTVEAAESTTFTVSYEYPLGTYDNPYEAELGASATVSVPKGGTVYYRWTATAAGYLRFSSSTATNNAMLYNLGTYVVTSYTGGAAGVCIYVNEGDEVSVAVASLSSDEVSEVEMTLTYHAGTEADPLPLFAGSNELTVGAGKALCLKVTDGATVSIAADGVSATVNGTACDSLTNITLSADDVLVITGAADSNTDVTVTVTAA